jgi:DNA gyrase/topoisomerase IV subunit B
LEYISYGFAKYGDTPKDFEEHVDEWIRMLVKIYPEIGYDHNTHQIKAVIDLVDQLVVVNDELVDQLRYLINILKKYGLLIIYTTKKGEKVQTTLSRYFEYIEKMYPVIKARYKGLGSSSAAVSREVIMDPRTRRLLRVTMDDVEIMKTMGMLVGDGKENKSARKEMLMNFKFTMDMIDN